MIVAVLAPLLFAVIVIMLAPLLLSHGDWRIRRPALALRAWLTAFAAGAAGLLVSLLAAIGEILFSLSRHSQDWIAPIAITVFGWVGLASVGALVALAAARYEPISAAARRTSIQLVLLAAASTYRRERLRGVGVCFVESDHAAAVASRACGRQIIVSRALADSLSAIQLRSVLEHERSHLADNHDRIVRLAQLNLACFPILLGARSFEQNVHLLVELAADDHAARRCGASTSADALDALAALGGDESVALRAFRLRQRVTAPVDSTAPGTTPHEAAA